MKKAMPFRFIVDNFLSLVVNTSLKKLQCKLQSMDKKNRRKPVIEKRERGVTMKSRSPIYLFFNNIIILSDY